MSSEWETILWMKAQWTATHSTMWRGLLKMNQVTLGYFHSYFLREIWDTPHLQDAESSSIKTMTSRVYCRGLKSGPCFLVRGNFLARRLPDNKRWSIFGDHYSILPSKSDRSAVTRHCRPAPSHLSLRPAFRVYLFFLLHFPSLPMLKCKIPIRDIPALYLYPPTQRDTHIQLTGSFPIFFLKLKVSLFLSYLIQVLIFIPMLGLQ